MTFFAIADRRKSPRPASPLLTIASALATEAPAMLVNTKVPPPAEIFLKRWTT
jgi:hypothetical protein